MVLSGADIKGSIVGMIVIFIACLLISLILRIAKYDYSKALLRIAVTMCSLFSISLVFSLFSFVISYVLYMIFS